jgi:hypothetical protein
MKLKSTRDNTQYVRRGKRIDEKDELQSTQIVLFEPQSFAVSANYVKIEALNDKLIEKHGKDVFTGNEFKQNLSNIRSAFVTFGSTWKNVHLYMHIESNKMLDPEYRICYISNLTESGPLRIKEHNDSRGAKYSALYKILFDRISHEQTHKFEIFGKEFEVDKANINQFVKIINEAISDLSSKEFDLYKDDEIYKIKFSKNEGEYWYNKVYWEEKDKNLSENDKFEERDSSKASTSILTDEEAIIAFESLIKTKNMGINSPIKLEAIERIKRILHSII